MCSVWTSGLPSGEGEDKKLVSEKRKLKETDDDVKEVQTLKFHMRGTYLD
jgi:hypothetical protein